mmetsp:Transcript_20447/g.30126  ORF Transcript_20447/g.30126 Transcript_20447/m.30126 type:complete len:225 (-) Transcript_20447:83-757(-)
MKESIIWRKAFTFNEVLLLQMISILLRHSLSLVIILCMSKAKKELSIKAYSEAMTVFKKNGVGYDHPRRIQLQNNLDDVVREVFWSSLTSSFEDFWREIGVVICNECGSSECNGSKNNDSNSGAKDALDVAGEGANMEEAAPSTARSDESSNGDNVTRSITDNENSIKDALDVAAGGMIVEESIMETETPSTSRSYERSNCANYITPMADYFNDINNAMCGLLY